MANDVVLGSGDLYLTDYTGSLPELSTIEVEGNRVGGIKGGATITYTPELYEVVDDMKRIKKVYVTKEDVVFKSGILTWDVAFLNKISIGGDFTTTSAKDTLKIGGATSVSEKILLFVHTLANKKKIKILMVGVPSNGWELAFLPDSESVIDAEFIGVPHNDAGNIIVIEQEKVTSSGK